MRIRISICIDHESGCESRVESVRTWDFDTFVEGNDAAWPEAASFQFGQLLQLLAQKERYGADCTFEEIAGGFGEGYHFS